MRHNWRIAVVVDWKFIPVFVQSKVQTRRLDEKQELEQGT